VNIELSNRAAYRDSLSHNEMDGSIIDIERNSDPGINAEVNNLVCRKEFDVLNIETPRMEEISESVTIK
jgi:hypothetical protein